MSWLARHKYWFQIHPRVATVVQFLNYFIQLFHLNSRLVDQNVKQDFFSVHLPQPCWLSFIACSEPVKKRDACHVMSHDWSCTHQVKESQGGKDIHTGSRINGHFISSATFFFLSFYKTILRGGCLENIDFEYQLYISETKLGSYMRFTSMKSLSFGTVAFSMSLTNCPDKYKMSSNSCYGNDSCPNVTLS